jgi:tetratricopeptide (TPR) repeat protein
MQAWRHYLGGVDHLNANQFSEAVEEFSEAVRIDPHFGQAYYQLGLATWWLYSDIGAGREYLVRLLEEGLYASEQEKNIAEAMLLVVDARFSEAIPVFETLTREYPDDKFIWYGLGEALFHFPGESRQGESLPAFERAAALDPDFLLPYWHIFAVLWGEERIDEAIARADTLIAAQPNNALWHRFRAASVAYTGDVERARAAVAEAEKVHTTAEERRELYKLVANAWGHLGYANLAEECLEKALNADPGHDDPQILKSLSMYLMAQNKYDEVEQRAQDLLDTDPDNDLYRSTLFEAQMAQHRYADVLREARGQAEAEPQNPRWYRFWAQGAVMTGDTASLPDILSTALQHSPAADDQRYLFGSVAQAYSWCGNQNEAIHYFRRAVDVESEPDALLPQAIGYGELRRGRHEQAESWFRKAAHIAPNSPQPHLLMALLEVERGRIDGARTRLAEAQKLQPPSKLQPFMGASLGILTGDDQAVDGLVTAEVDELTADWQKWRFLFGEPGHFPLGVAWAYLLAQRTEEAEAMFISGTSFDFARNDPVAHRGLGLTYLTMARYDKAEDAFQAGLETGRDKGPLLRGIGTARLLQGDAVGAEEYARRALAEDHPHIDSWRLLGFALAAQGRHAEALEAAEHSVAMDSSRTSYELLAWVLVSGNVDLERGIETARRALELPSSFLDVEKGLPHRAGAHHSLGRAYLKQGKMELAAQQLAKAAEVQPNRASIREDLMRLNGARGGT